VECAFETRPASLADLDALLTDVQAGFDSYADFAFAGWQPRSVEQDRESTAELLSDAETWALLALAHGRPAGHVSFFPARDREPRDRRHWSERPRIPGLAHLWQLFVLPDWWGRGVAPVLHDAAVDEMSARGFEQARLYTPSAHARARRFYERRKWSAGGEMWNDELQLVLTEYRLALQEGELVRR
jgi:GNAT superfamily N-acetyltransferase